MRVPPLGLIAMQLEHVQAASSDRGEFLGRAMYVCNGRICRRASRESEGAFQAFGPGGPIWLKSWPKADLEVQVINEAVRAIDTFVSELRHHAANAAADTARPLFEGVLPSDDEPFQSPDSIEE